MQITLAIHFPVLNNSWWFIYILCRIPEHDHQKRWWVCAVTIKLNGQGTLGDCILFRDILCQNHYITFGWAMGMPLNMNVWQSLWAAVVGGVPSCYSNYSADDENKSQSGSGEFITDWVHVGPGETESKRLDHFGTNFLSFRIFSPVGVIATNPKPRRNCSIINQPRPPSSLFALGIKRT